MRRRYLVSLLFACALLFLPGMFTDETVAQHKGSIYPSYVAQPASFDDLTAIFKRASIPVQIYHLEGPGSLFVGEEGRFSAGTNSEKASLPVHAEWNFGDGTTARGLHTLHRYIEPGTYLVTFTLANKYTEVSDTLTVTVVPEGHPAASRKVRAQNLSDEGGNQ